MAIRNKSHPLVFEAALCQGTINMPSYWYVNCNEIPGWTIEKHIIPMAAIINACFTKARSMGHFGRVKVVFETEKPF